MAASAIIRRTDCGENMRGILILVLCMAEVLCASGIKTNEGTPAVPSQQEGTPTVPSQQESLGDIARRNREKQQANAPPMPRVVMTNVSGDWTRLSCDEGNFEVLFPATPREEVESPEGKMRGGRVSFRASLEDDVHYMLLYDDLANINAENAEQGLDLFRRMFAQGDRTLVAEKRITLAGYPGRELVITEKGRVIKHRLYAVALGTGQGSRIYTLIVVNGNEKDAGKFFSSFKLLSTLTH